MCELLEGIRCADSLAMFYVLGLEIGTGKGDTAKGTGTVLRTEPVPECQFPSAVPECSPRVLIPLSASWRLE